MPTHCKHGHLLSTSGRYGDGKCKLCAKLKKRGSHKKQEIVKVDIKPKRCRCDRPWCDGDVCMKCGKWMVVA